MPLCLSPNIAITKDARGLFLQNETWAIREHETLVVIMLCHYNDIHLLIKNKSEKPWWTGGEGMAATRSLG